MFKFPLPGNPIHFLYDCSPVVALSLLHFSIMHRGRFRLEPGALISASHIPAVAMPDMPDSSFLSSHAFGEPQTLSRCGGIIGRRCGDCVCGSTEYRKSS